MVGQQFWSKVQLRLFRNQQLLYFLLLGIALFSFTVVWAIRASLSINVFDSNLGLNSSLTHRYGLLSAAHEANQVQSWIQAPELSYGEGKQEKIFFFQTPGFIREINPKSKSQNPTSNDEPNFRNEGLEPFIGQGSSRRLIAALEGYDVKFHGFSFENYGDEKDYVQLTSAEVERLFGERVCASKVDGECFLTPLAQQWMEQKNKSMGRGHCDGMATLSLLFYLNQIKVEEFGSSSVNSLQLDGNQKLQREIAYWWATQSTEPTRSARDRNALTPHEVVNQLVEAFKAGRNSEVYTVAFWKPNRRGGHAVTPFAVEERGNNMFAILVYDNNYPNTIREILVDSNADTWRYNSSVNPDMPEQEYQGDAKTKTLLLTPTSFRLQLQKCPFCEENNFPVASKEEAGKTGAHQDLN